MNLAARGARELGKDPQVILDFAVCGVLAGVVVGPPRAPRSSTTRRSSATRWRILKFWEGLSSMGGLLGGILAAAVYFRRKRLRFHDYADAFALGIAPGWGIARLGCFTVHDHPGVRTDFFLAVRFPAGARHDLGLYEAILLFALAALLWALHRRGRPARAAPRAARGRRTALGRFLLDFLRARRRRRTPTRATSGSPPRSTSRSALVAWRCVARSRRHRRLGRGARRGASRPARGGDRTAAMGDGGRARGAGALAQRPAARARRGAVAAPRRGSARPSTR